MLTDSNCISRSPATKGASAPNSAPWMGQVALQPVNINCSAVMRPRRRCVNSTRLPSSPVNESLGASCGGRSGPKGSCGGAAVCAVAHGAASGESNANILRRCRFIDAPLSR
jgi:hypothetical protein